MNIIKTGVYDVKWHRTRPVRLFNKMQKVTHRLGDSIEKNDRESVSSVPLDPIIKNNIDEKEIFQYVTRITKTIRRFVYTERVPNCDAEWE